MATSVMDRILPITPVALNGVDSLLPRIRFPNDLCAVHDEDQGGRFQIEPCLTNARIRQLYLPDTIILLTRFLAEEGVAELTD